VGRGIALLFHDHSTRKGVSGQQHAPAAPCPGIVPVPIVQKTGRAPGPVWTGGKSRPHRDSIPYRPARSSVAIPTELPRPQVVHVFGFILGIYHDAQSPERQSLRINLIRHFNNLKISKDALGFAVLVYNLRMRVH